MGIMNAVIRISDLQSTPIRPLNMAKDLDRVADLVEMCFPIYLDRDGQTYIRQMRETARELRGMPWLAHLAGSGNASSTGFVWEEGNKILGNLSLITIQHAGRPMKLIANVAVHPEHRRRGIARALTDRALTYLHQRHESPVWLQVRDDNPAAINLYRNAGFVDQVYRTTWRARPQDLKSDHAPHRQPAFFLRRIKGDWTLQEKLLAVAYPFNIRWNLPVDFQRFVPGILQGLTNFMDGYALKHWRLEHRGKLMGVITWQKTTTYANNLWLALPEPIEAEYLPFALQEVSRRLAKEHPVSINYPAGRARALFESLGFEQLHTLIWMKLQL